jgi:hypothetical protein
MNLNDFISLSGFLLGIPFKPPLPPINDLDPDLGQFYLDLLNKYASYVPKGSLTDLASTWQSIQAQPSSQWDAQVRKLIFGTDLNDWAQQIIYVWYTGSMWVPNLPSGNPNTDRDAERYERTLVWWLAQAHPMGVPKSFGYWQYPPSGTGS